MSNRPLDPDCTATLSLATEDFVAAGGGRRVYHHPTRDDLLIKVLHPERRMTRKPRHHRFFKRVTNRLRAQRHRMGRFIEWYQEYEEYIAIMARIDDVPDFIAGYRGFVQTDQGPGIIVEKLVDADGRVAPTVQQYLKAGGDPDELATLARTFFDQAAAARAVFKDLSLNNLVVAQRRGGSALVAVDGLSDNNLIRIRVWSHRYHRRWIFAKRDAFLARIAAFRR